MEEIRNSPSADKKAKEKHPRKKRTPFIRNLLISCVLLAITAILLSAWLVFRPDKKAEKHDLFNIEMISELTTLECRYHNVAVRDIEGNALSVGKQYVWFEYDVIVKVGIDTTKVKIEEPNADGVIKIYLPPAEILGADADESTISKPVCDLGLFTELTVAEERQIISEGVEKLKNDKKTDEIIRLADNSAKNVLEQYVINMSKLIGEEYTVEWIEVPKDIQAATDNPTDSATE